MASLPDEVQKRIPDALKR